MAEPELGSVSCTNGLATKEADVITAAKIKCLVPLPSLVLVLAVDYLSNKYLFQRPDSEQLVEVR